MANVPARGIPDGDDELVRLAADGYEPAWARIVRVHHANLVRMCVVATGDVDVASAAVAETWPEAMRRIRRLGNPARLGPWLRAITVDQALRARPRPAFVLGGRDQAALDADFGTGAGDWPADRPLADALAALPLEDRLLLAERSVGAGDEAAGRVPVLLDGLAAAVADPGTGSAAARARIDERLRDHAAFPVRPVDVDKVARAALTEIELGRRHRASVAIAAFLFLSLYVITIGLEVRQHSAAPGPTPGPSMSPAIPRGVAPAVPDDPVRI